MLLTIAGMEVGIPLLADDSTTHSPEDIAFFEKNIRPLLVKHCYQCHADQQAKGGLRLDSRMAVRKGGDTRPAIVIGNPAKSLLVEAVDYQNPDLQMPPKKRISNSEIQLLKDWIQMGAPDPRASETATNLPTGMSIHEGRKFWSMQPVGKPPIPEVASTGINHQWTRNPVDSFLLAEMKKRGLSPAQPADRQTWIRRVTFDLLGLPPTAEEVRRFLDDRSPSAFENVVDRLLASPQYGVRWGRHWLDVVRYADSNGLDENLAFGNAWRYRDYVIQSLNDDKPVNQWVTEQLAGDLLPNANQETRTATGFLALGAKVLAEPDREKLTMDTIDEQLDTIGKTFLGLTLGCARCHDHKFDPIKQTDYYSLAAIFKNTKTFADSNTGAIKHWYEHSFATEAEQETVKQSESVIAKLKQKATDFKNAEYSRLRQQARTKVVDYLVAASGIEISDSLTEVAAQAEKFDLHPRILHHCRLHLHYQRENPLFEKWHTSIDSPDQIRQFYDNLFARVNAAWESTRKASPKANALEDSVLELARQALFDPVGFLAVPPKVEFAFDAQNLTKYSELLEKSRITESAAPDAAAAMGVTDGIIKESLPIHIRGNHRSLGDAVQREFPEVLRISTIRPVFPEHQSGRLELARWIVDSRNPLTARVFVNRIWRWHFGNGLVPSTENFGVLGERPSHPQLLNWLARRLMQSGWSIKDLHRLILTSSAYRMSSTPLETNNLLNPANRWLTHFPMRRLEAEEIRDSVLAVSNRLNRSLGGKTVPLRNRQFVFDHTSIDHTRYQSVRRAVYLPVIRNNLYTLFEQFDFPDPTLPTGNRSETTVAPQALLMLNSDWVMNSADDLAAQIVQFGGDNRQRCQKIYQRILGRDPTPDEIKRILEFIAQRPSSESAVAKQDSGMKSRPSAWSLVCQSLFCCNENLYLK